jgi:hypothetical protein
MAKFPHCDSNILHAPGQCVYCDKYPDEQLWRYKANINYTGEDIPGKLPCPAEFARSREKVNAWGGNVPISFADLKTKKLDLDWILTTDDEEHL